MLLTFDSDSENWLVASTNDPASYVSVNSRIGLDSVRVDPPASTNEGVKLSEVNFDLSSYSGADKFIFAYQCNSWVDNIKFRFHTDNTNYFQFETGVQTSGYKITEFNKSDATASGSPSWESITEVRVYVFATSGGTAQVDLDAVRVEDIDTINPDYAMVARELLTTPVFKEAGKVLEVEFGLGVTL